MTHEPLEKGLLTEATIQIRVCNFDRQKASNHQLLSTQRNELHQASYLERNRPRSVAQLDNNSQTTKTARIQWQRISTVLKRAKSGFPIPGPRPGLRAES